MSIVQQIVYIFLSICMICTSSFSEIPKQFQVWGKTIGVMSAFPPGWKEVSIEDKGSGLDVTKDDKERGYVIFSRHAQEVVYKYTKPSNFEKTENIKLFTCPGEYEPITFSLYGVKNTNVEF